MKKNKQDWKACREAVAKLVKTLHEVDAMLRCEKPPANPFGDIFGKDGPFAK